MYEKLIAELRQHHCDAREDDTQEVCEECAYDVIIADKSVPSGIASVCVCGLMHRAADAIEGLTAADVRPVVRGWWIERTHKLYDGRYAYSIECTHCHEVFTEIDLTIKPTKRNFCPDCGADMREGS